MFRLVQQDSNKIRVNALFRQTQPSPANKRPAEYGTLNNHDSISRWSKERERKSKSSSFLTITLSDVLPNTGDLRGMLLKETAIKLANIRGCNYTLNYTPTQR